MANFYLDFLMIEMIVNVNNARFPCSHMEIMLDYHLEMIVMIDFW